MEKKMNVKAELRPRSASKRSGMLLGALSLVALGLSACGDLDWLRDGWKGHGGGTPVPDGGTSGGADAAACVAGELAHPVTCEESPSGKDQAWAACKSLGLELNDFAPAQCNAGQILNIEYLCCPAGTPPATHVPPP